VALGYRSRASVASPHPQRHITGGATEEILCGPPHKISQSHCEPSGSLGTDKHSIGSTNEAFLAGSERSLLIALCCISAAYAITVFHNTRVLLDAVPVHVDFKFSSFRVRDITGS
jgi:hypothetical protein